MNLLRPAAFTVALWLCLVAFFVFGCAKEPATFTPAPRTTQTRDSVFEDAEVWKQRDPENRYYTPVAATGSMEPVINEHSIIQCLRYRGEWLPNGAVLIFDRNGKRVLHVQSDQTETHVYMSGYNAAHSDGWYPKSTIEGYVVGQLYLPQ